MLFTDTITPRTLALLHGLGSIPSLSQFLLVGGTNLSLRYGHRVSIDLDLFTNLPFNPEEVFTDIVERCPHAIKLDQRRQSIWMTIDGIKVDVLLHEYPYIKGVEVVEGIRLLAVEDVIPMKLEAMATRGVKKDFWDLVELLNHFSLAQMLQFHQQKYSNSDIGHILLAATYFSDAEKERIDPISLNGMTWDRVKESMLKAVNDFVKSQL